MELLVLCNPMNNLSNNNAILPGEVLQYFQNEISSTKDGILYKITFKNKFLETNIEKFVSCVEFTAPENTIYLSEDLYDEFVFSDNEINLVKVEPFSPPQATKIIFKIENDCILQDGLIKSKLETLITKSYKFLELKQKIKIDNIIMTIITLEPYHICMVNNSDVEVEFDITFPLKEQPVPTVHQRTPRVVPKLEEVVCANTIFYKCDDTQSSKPTVQEMREKRLQFYK